MKTIGKFLKEARIRKKYSQESVAKETKIKKEFISAIERENWESLPEFPTVLGFVKKISKFLKVDERQAVAILRRDYPPKVLPVNPKPDISKRFVWSPKLTFLVGSLVVVGAVLTYLGFQYSKFVSPPKLTVLSPQDGAVVTVRELEVEGRTDPDASVKINNQPVLVEEDGDFKAKVEIFNKTEEIEIRAISRSGKETVIHRKIVVELAE